jgi:hypothetical protein
MVKPKSVPGGKWGMSQFWFSASHDSCLDTQHLAHYARLNLEAGVEAASFLQKLE